MAQDGDMALFQSLANWEWVENSIGYKQEVYVNNSAPDFYNGKLFLKLERTSPEWQQTTVKIPFNAINFYELAFTAKKVRGHGGNSPQSFALRALDTRNNPKFSETTIPGSRSAPTTAVEIRVRGRDFETAVKALFAYFEKAGAVGQSEHLYGYSFPDRRP